MTLQFVYRILTNVLSSERLSLVVGQGCSYKLARVPKLARVVPIFKNGDKSDLNNYRPISIISSVAKVFQKIVYDQFYEYLSVNDLFSHQQSGFRPTYSNVTALLESTNDWCVNIDNGLVNEFIFIDLKKAFDTIDHEILINKLECYGVDCSALGWFKSYLSDRKQSAS